MSFSFSSLCSVDSSSLLIRHFPIALATGHSCGHPVSYTDELRSVRELLNDFRVRGVTFKPSLSLSHLYVPLTHTVF